MFASKCQTPFAFHKQSTFQRLICHSCHSWIIKNVLFERNVNLQNLADRHEFHSLCYELSSSICVPQTTHTNDFFSRQERQSCIVCLVFWKVLVKCHLWHFWRIIWKKSQNDLKFVHSLVVIHFWNKSRFSLPVILRFAFDRTFVEFEKIFIYYSINYKVSQSFIRMSK